MKVDHFEPTRLLALMAIRMDNPHSIAMGIGTDANEVARWMSGAAKPSPVLFNGLCLRFGVPPGWFQRPPIAPSGPMFICGRDMPDSPLASEWEDPICRWCGRESTLLCDAPMAVGTCDRGLCVEHATEVGPDRHLCPDHVESA